MDVDSIWNILEGLTSKDVYAAYIKSMAQYKIIGIGTALGISVSLFLLVKEYGEVAYAALGFKEGVRIEKPNYAKLFGLFRPTIYVIIVVFSYPYLLDLIEQYFSGFQDSLDGAVNPESDLKVLWKQEAEQYQKLMAKTTTWDIGKKMSIIINYYIILLIKPFFVLFGSGCLFDFPFPSLSVPGDTGAFWRCGHSPLSEQGNTPVHLYLVETYDVQLCHARGICIRQYLCRFDHPGLCGE